MERVVFHVEATGERISCLLNPETVLVTRAAGAQRRQYGRGEIAGIGGADDAIVFTGGGRTTLELQLLFDVDLGEAARTPAPADVRDLTGPLWRLAENSSQERGGWRPPLVRFVWGKAWSVPGIVAALSERFDRFDPSGIPQRSWLSLRFLRVAQRDEPPPEYATVSASGVNSAANGSAPTSLTSDATDPAVTTTSGSSIAVPAGGSASLPLLAWQTLGNPYLWRVLATANDIDDPLGPFALPVLAVPELPLGGSMP